jgi:hypothetical protein
MSNGPAKAPAPGNRCPKGHENPLDRIYCDECGMRISVAQKPPLGQRDTADSEELMRLQRELEAEREANRDLLHQVNTLTRDIAARHSSEGKVVSDAADLGGKLSAAEQHAAVLESQLLDVQEKLKSADDKNSSLERQLAQKTRNAEGGPGPHRGFLRIIAGSLGVVGLLLGYGLGYHAQQTKNQRVIVPANQNGTNEQKAANQLRAMVAQDQDQINNLKSQLDAANQNVAKLSDEVAKDNTKDAVAQKKLGQTQGQLNTERDENSIAVNQMRNQLLSKTQEAARLRQQATDIAAELAALQEKHPSWNYPGAPVGTYQWQGEAKEKNINITIDEKGIHYSNARNIFEQGSLPKVPFGWKHVVINSDGKGKITAQLVWSVL